MDTEKLTEHLGKAIIITYKKHLYEISQLMGMEVNENDKKYLEILMINTDDMMNRLISIFKGILIDFDGDEEDAIMDVADAIDSECRILAEKALGINNSKSKVMYISRLVMETYIQCVKELEEQYNIPHSVGPDQDIIFGVFRNKADEIISGLKFDTDNSGDPRGLIRDQFVKAVHDRCVPVAKLALNIKD